MSVARLLCSQSFKQHSALAAISRHGRALADTPKSKSTSKQVVGSEKGERLRVRRARPADEASVLRLVRGQTRGTGLSAVTDLVFGDLVARILAQGHSLVAERAKSAQGILESRDTLRGLALIAALCAWDASLLERHARCILCPNSRRLLLLAAHCLRTPSLHRKYSVHNLLQVTLLVPHEQSERGATAGVLAGRALQRATNLGYPLVRFDVGDDIIANSLKDLPLKKEWKFHFDLNPGSSPEHLQCHNSKCSNFVTVYSAHLLSRKQS